MSARCRSHFVCLPCRASWKKEPRGAREHLCPQCCGPLIDAGTQFAAPRRRDTAGWRALSAVLHAGLRVRPSCRCCNDGAGYRPRTPREVRERLAHAAATGESADRALVRPDPARPDERRGPGGRARGCTPDPEAAFLRAFRLSSS